MNKSSALGAALLAVSLSSAYATTVTFSGVPTARSVVDSSSATVATPGLIWAGSFSNPGSFSLNNTVSLAANVAAVTASGGWKQFTLDPSTGLQDPGISDTLVVSASGKVGGGLTDNNSPQANYFNGSNLYLWIFNGPSVGASTEMGIFHATAATTPWVFPTNGGGVGDSVTLSTTTSGATIAAIGGFGSTPSGQLKLTNNFNVATVPEPSTLFVGLFVGTAGLCGRRRRK